jgi:hypothetical protein
MYDMPLSLDSTQQFIFHTIGSNDLLQPLSAQHFKTFQAFLIFFPKCPIFSTIQRYGPNVTLYSFFLKFNKFAGEIVFLLNAEIASVILDLISRVPLALFVTVQPR